MVLPLFGVYRNVTSSTRSPRDTVRYSATMTADRHSATTAPDRHSATTAPNQLAAIGSLLGDGTRSEILLALLDGRARTGSELARHLSLARSTVSEHLSRLLDGGLVVVEAQGRHRYYRLAGVEVARLLETIGTAGVGSGPPAPRAPVDLALARTCYDHLAGSLAVELHRRLVQHEHLVIDADGTGRLAPSGEQLLAGLGIDPAALTAGRRPIVRACLDWTERRHHLAGAAGAALLAALLEHGWLREGNRPRVLVVTESGRRVLPSLFACHGSGGVPDSVMDGPVRQWSLVHCRCRPQTNTLGAGGPATASDTTRPAERPRSAKRTTGK